MLNPVIMTGTFYFGIKGDKLITKVSGNHSHRHAIYISHITTLGTIVPNTISLSVIIVLLHVSIHGLSFICLNCILIFTVTYIANPFLYIFTKNCNFIVSLIFLSYTIMF